MKDEYAGKVAYEFYGTGAKAYAVVVENSCIKKAKGKILCYITINSR